MSRLRRALGRSLLAASLLLLLFTLFCFFGQPQLFVAYTVLPIWLWGGIGLVASAAGFAILRGRWSWIITALWSVTLLVGADEACVLTHWGKTAPLPGPPAPHDGSPVLRVITFNCDNLSSGDPSKDLAAWQPDIVLLQDVFPYQVSQIARFLFGDHGDFRAYVTNGIVTRFKIQREIPSNTLRDHQATITLPDGSAVEVVNVHLATAATDLRFWQRDTWRRHRVNSAVRLDELSLVQEALDRSAPSPNRPTIFGGDFNAPATDAVHRQLSRQFTDAFAAAGTGWGNTYHRRFPILRIDHLYTSDHFTPVRCHTVTSRLSDHRMVVADYLMKR